MLKKIGFPILALFALMIFVTPPQASAAVRFGIAVGGPVYAAPAPAYAPPYSYADPYYAPGYNNVYAAPAPVYSYPYGYYGGGYGYGYRDHDRYYDRGYYRGGHEFREHDRGHRR